ncbi:Gfo/Idh/MocA family protein [Microlunatus sp. Y2014]|uniref:Gfo/Idh/MocA family protein n=1 Tax=Microlunatus sp. Y2014 TaxID=3418488 RepID=UPI003DA78D3C
MSETIRWGVLGPGRIADNVAGDFDNVPGGELRAVGSRSLDRARAFADKHGIPNTHGSYADLIADPEVDALYIATPHPQHLQLALAGIAAGKPLLVEKSLTATVAGAEQLIAAARAAGVFAMEAMWTRFQPMWVKARELIADGALGEVRQVSADLGVDRPFDPTARLFDPAQGGGALLDVGVYPVSLAQWLLGTPDAVHTSGRQAPTGVDEQAALLFSYEDGRAALLQASIAYPLPGGARVVGDQGRLDVLPRFHHPTDMVLTRRDGSTEEFHLPSRGVGYAHEFDEVHRCLAEGLTESPVMPLADTLTVLRLLEEASGQLGVVHHEDETVLPG